MACFTAAVVLVALVSLTQGQMSLLDLLSGASTSNTNQQGLSSNQVKQEQIITNLLSQPTGNQWTSNQLNQQPTMNQLNQQPTMNQLNQQPTMNQLKQQPITRTQFNQQPTTRTQLTTGTQFNQQAATGTQFNQQAATGTQFNQQPTTRTQFNQQAATGTQFNMGVLGQPKPSPNAGAAAAAVAPDGFNQPVPPGHRRVCTRAEKDTLFNRCAMTFGMSHMNQFSFLRSRRQCQVRVFQCPHVDSMVKCINSQPVSSISNNCWLNMKNELTEFLHRYRLPCQFEDVYNRCKTKSVTLSLISERQTAGSGMNNNVMSNILPMIMRFAMPMMMMGMMGGA